MMLIEAAPGRRTDRYLAMSSRMRDAAWRSAGLSISRPSISSSSGTVDATKGYPNSTRAQRQECLCHGFAASCRGSFEGLQYIDAWTSREALRASSCTAEGG